MYILNKCSKLINRNFLFNSVRLLSSGNFSKLSQNDNETQLASHLKMIIKTKGPITVSDYIKECLGNPKHVNSLVKYSVN